VVGPTYLLETDGLAEISAEFTDPGVRDGHYAEIDWGNGVVTNGNVIDNGGWGTVTASYVYGVPGTYLVTVTVYDDVGAGRAVFDAVQVNAPSEPAGPPDDAGSPDGIIPPEDTTPPDG
jgi:hypothetical protein